MDGEMPGDEQIDVWLIQLPEDGPLSPQFAPCLSAEESARAARFIFERDRARFTVAHTALRQILATCTGGDSAVEIRVAELGKPYLPGHPGIRFNLSHSGCYALAAVAHGREVGVDIECIRADRSSTAIAERFFAPAEVGALKKTPEKDRVPAFFACWSRKEAYIKARGLGLRIPLDSFEVSLGAEAILRKAEDRDRWSMCSLEAPEGYAAALVAEGSGWRVRRLEWRPRQPGHPET